MTVFRPPCSTSSILLYQPLFGDYVIWSKWFSVWHGFLMEHDNKNSLTFMMSGLPSLLVSVNNDGKSIVKIDLDKIRNSRGGRFTIIRFSPEQNRMIWYV